MSAMVCSHADGPKRCVHGANQLTFTEITHSFAWGRKVPVSMMCHVVCISPKQPGRRLVRIGPTLSFFSSIYSPYTVPDGGSCWRRCGIVAHTIILYYNVLGGNVTM